MKPTLVRQLKPGLLAQTTAAVKYGPGLLRKTGIVLAATPGWILATAAMAGTVLWYRYRRQACAS